MESRTSPSESPCARSSARSVPIVNRYEANRGSRICNREGHGCDPLGKTEQLEDVNEVHYPSQSMLPGCKRFSGGNEIWDNRSRKWQLLATQTVRMQIRNSWGRWNGLSLLTWKRTASGRSWKSELVTSSRFSSSSNTFRRLPIPSLAYVIPLTLAMQSFCASVRWPEQTRLTKGFQGAVRTLKPQVRLRSQLHRLRK
jgi:hypothetical protein